MDTTSLVAQFLKNLPAIWETRVQSLDWEDPLEKEITTHSSIFAWRIPWTEEPGRLQSMGSQRLGHNWVTNTFFFRKNTMSSFSELRVLFLYVHRTSVKVGQTLGHNSSLHSFKGMKSWSAFYDHSGFKLEINSKVATKSISMLENCEIAICIIQWSKNKM